MICYFFLIRLFHSLCIIGFNRRFQAVPFEPPPAEIKYLTSFRLSYPGIATLTGFSLHQVGDELHYCVRAELDKTSTMDFEEADVFIHLIDENGKQLQVMDIRLRSATFAANRPVVHRLSGIPAKLLNKNIRVRIGLYRPRTRERFKPTGAATQVSPAQAGEPTLGKVKSDALTLEGYLFTSDN